MGVENNREVGGRQVAATMAVLHFLAGCDRAEIKVEEAGFDEVAKTMDGKVGNLAADMGHAARKTLNDCMVYEAHNGDKSGVNPNAPLFLDDSRVFQCTDQGAPRDWSKENEPDKVGGALSFECNEYGYTGGHDNVVGVKDGGPINEIALEKNKNGNGKLKLVTTNAGGKKILTLNVDENGCEILVDGEEEASVVESHGGKAIADCREILNSTATTLAWTLRDVGFAARLSTLAQQGVDMCLPRRGNRGR